MDGRVVVGVGNIYANEALYMAGIRPDIPAGKPSRVRYLKLVNAVKQVLSEAIEAGGTSLKDFVREDGSPGYFKQSLNVYGRGGEPCLRLRQSIERDSPGSTNDGVLHSVSDLRQLNCAVC